MVKKESTNNKMLHGTTYSGKLQAPHFLCKSNNIHLKFYCKATAVHTFIELEN